MTEPARRAKVAQSDLDAVVAALAAARVGGVVSTRDDPDAPAVVASSGSTVPAAGRTRVLRGADVREPDLDWEAMLRAGRTDPAAAEVFELRVFGGISIEEAARGLGLSRSAAYRHWTYARAWLLAERGDE